RGELCGSLAPIEHGQGAAAGAGTDQQFEEFGPVAGEDCDAVPARYADAEQAVAHLPAMAHQFTETMGLAVKADGRAVGPGLAKRGEVVCNQHDHALRLSLLCEPRIEPLARAR